MASWDDPIGSVERNDAARVREILAARPELARARDPRLGFTALHRAVLPHRAEIVQILVEAGADVNARDERFGATPKGWAVEDYLQHGALLGIEIEDFLHAVKTGQLESVDRWLARNPAFARAADEEGTAVEHAERRGHAAIAERLRAVH